MPKSQRYVLSAPFVGIWLQKKIESRKTQVKQKEHIFRTLMATRARRLSPEHVQALNMIDLEFYPKTPSDRAVIAAWKEYRGHLSYRLNE